MIGGGGGGGVGDTVMYMGVCLIEIKTAEISADQVVGYLKVHLHLKYNKICIYFI